VFANDTSNDFCITGPSFVDASGWSTSSPVEAPAGKLYLWVEHTTTHAGQAYGFVIARAGDGVNAATFRLEDGAEGARRASTQPPSRSESSRSPRVTRAVMMTAAGA
jgi:hypothetical protein